MMKTLLSTVLLVAAFPAAAFSCGLERWPVKVGQDKQKNYLFKDRKVSTHTLLDPVDTTVYKLSVMKWPFQDWGPTQKSQEWANVYRAGTAEFTIWRVSATLLRKRNEDDEDYHLVLKKGKRTMIAEIPGESCVADSPEPIRSMVRQARQDFDAWYDDQPDKDHLDTKVTIVGVGFFDRVHGNADGQVKKNGIEIHPVLKIEFH